MDPLCKNRLRSFLARKDSRYKKLSAAFERQDDGALLAIAQYLLTGIDPRFAEPWKLFYGIEGTRESARSLLRRYPELKGRKVLILYRLRCANQILTARARREAYYKFLLTGAMPTDGPDRPLFLLNLSLPTLNALAAKGILTVHDLTRSNDHYVRHWVLYIGEMRFSEIKSELERHGLSFAT